MLKPIPEWRWIKVCLLFFLITSQGWTQTNRLSDSLYLQSKIEWNTKFEGGASANSFAFIKPFVYGGFITPEQIFSEWSQLNPINSAGGFAETELSYRFTNSNKQSFRWSYAEYLTGSITFSRDLFDLVFRGNLNKNMYELSPGQFNLSRFKSLFFETLRYRKSRWTFQFGIGGIMGNRNIQAQLLPNSRLDNTLPEQSLCMYLNARYQSSGINLNNSNQINGFGLGLRAFCETALDSVWKISAGIRNLGLLGWHQNLNVRQWDTLLYWSGISPQSLGSDSIETPWLALSAQPNNSNASYLTPLPAEIHLECVHTNLQGIETIRAGLQYRFIPAYLPLIYTEHYFGKGFVNPSFFLAYGGFSQTQYGFGLRGRYKGCFLEIQGRALQNFIFKNSPLAFHLTTQLCFVF